MKKTFLKYLCCPECKSDFRLEIIEEKGEVVEGNLICKSCNNKYPIIKTIPVILNKSGLKDFSKTKTNWENWWDKIREKGDVELFDRLWVQAEKNLGGEPLYRKNDFEGKVVLDAGCGNGRYIKSDFSKFNCREIIAVDIGNQVFLAKKENKNLKNVHYLQADLTNLPLKNECADVIASHGVLHHTPDPKKTFSSLCKHLKIGGMFAIYVYHKEWAYFKTHRKSLLLDAVYANGVLMWQTIRKITSRMPHLLLLFFVYLMATKSTIEYKLIKNRYFGAFGRISQLIPPFAYEGVNFHERLVRNYDHYSATFNYFQSIDEVVDWFESNNLNDLEIASVPVSIRGFKKKSKELPLRIKQYPFIEHFKFRKEWEKLYKNIQNSANKKK